MHQLTLDQFRRGAETGALLSVTIRALGAKFRIEAETRGGEATLITRRDKTPREFANPIKAFSLLRELGITEYRVDAKGWRPDEAAADRRSRPDRAEALRASHDAYVRIKLARSLADTRPAVSHDDVMAEAGAVHDRDEAKRAADALLAATRRLRLDGLTVNELKAVGRRGT